MNELIELTTLQERIFTIRGKRVMIDKDLAELYKTKTMALNQAVKRNIKRFPPDFMFKLNDDEVKELITNCDRFKTLKHSSNNPYAFTEHGVAMLSGILNSDKAIEINIQIMRAFIYLRQYAIEHQELSAQIQDLKKYLFNYCKDNEADKLEIYKAIDLLMDRTKPTKIGFNTDK